MQISNQRIRLAIDTSQMGGINDVLTGANPQFWNGVDLQIELGIFYGSTLLDVSNLDSITVDLKESDPRTGLPLMSQTIASGSLNPALTLNAWNGGASTDVHAVAVFSNTETNLYLSDDAVTFWLVVSALTNDSPGHKIVLGATPLVVQEGGEGVEPPASVVNPTYYTAAQSDARYAVAVDLTSINNAVATLNSEMTAVTATANAAMPKSGGIFSGAVTVTGLSGVLKAPGGVLTSGATTTDLPEGTNLYWTQTRFNTALAAVSGAASGVCPLDSTSHIPSSYLPALAFNNTYVVASQSAMLALTANPGDICVRTDLSQTFILSTLPASTLANWVQLLQPSNAVTSVNSLTGAVVLTTTNIAEGANQYFTTARAAAAALAATLTGFSSATGGTVTSGDTILSALGKFENRMAVNDAKVSAVGCVKADGSVAMTGMLNFSGTGNAGIQLSNLTDTQRAALSALNGMLIYNSTLSCVQYYNGGWTTLAAGAAASWYNGSGSPSSTLGNNGDYYLNTANGNIYQKSAGSWSVLYSYPSSSGGLTVPYSQNLTMGTASTSGQLGVQFACTASTYPVYPALQLTVGSTSLGFDPGGNSILLGLNASTGVMSVWVGGSQCVTQRQSGWSAPTGTLARGALNTGTATTSVIAQTLGALITDLMTHGLIGA